MNGSDTAASRDAAHPQRGVAPIIGITSYLEQAQTGVWNVRASFLPETYLRAVTDAGGIAVVLPPQPTDPATVARIIAAIDGLIVAGGADIDPRRYGQTAHAHTGTPRRDRDDFETALLLEALTRELPLFGICRGAQLLNVALGGDLIQHLPDQVGDDRYQLGGGQFNRIAVELQPGSRIAELYGNAHSTIAPLYHHQAIGRLGAGLNVTSRTADGVIEAIELPEAPFCLAVQWHPEEDTEDRRLFTALIRAARTYRAARSSTRPREQHA